MEDSLNIYVSWKRTKISNRKNIDDVLATPAEHLKSINCSLPEIVFYLKNAILREREIKKTIRIMRSAFEYLHRLCQYLSVWWSLSISYQSTN